MELIFDILLIALLSISIALNFVIYRTFVQKENFHETLVKAVTAQTEQLSYTSNKIDALGHGFDRSMLALRELLESTKPIRTNNWDSVREAFKGPARIEVNERN